MTTANPHAYTIDEINVMAETGQIDPRNILDEFKGKPHDEVVQAHRERQTEMVAIAINMTHDFNKGTVLRASAFFNVKSFYFLNKPNNMIPNHPEGTKRWDKRGAVGVQNYVDIKHMAITRYKELMDELRADGYTIYAVENLEEYNPKSYYNVAFPKKSAFIVGEEQTGVPKEILEYCDDYVYIGGLGSTPRSLNVATAYSIIAGDYMRQNYPM